MIIGYTVNYDKVGEQKVGYLTGDELLLIQNMACLDRSGKEIDILSDMCSRYEQSNPGLYISEYKLFAALIAGYKGDEGDFEKSDELFMRVIKTNTEMRRLKYTARCLYGLWWNADAKGKSTDEEKKNMLGICIDISSFTKEKQYYDFFMKKQESLRNGG
ncbi:MAG: hypothetical protein ACI4R6_05845 [Lachnospiraceae bacterium]